MSGFVSSDSSNEFSCKVTVFELVKPSSTTHHPTTSTKCSAFIFTISMFALLVFIILMATNSENSDSAYTELLHEQLSNSVISDTALISENQPQLNAFVSQLLPLVRANQHVKDGLAVSDALVETEMEQLTDLLARARRQKQIVFDSVQQRDAHVVRIGNVFKSLSILYSKARKVLPKEFKKITLCFSDWCKTKEFQHIFKISKSDVYKYISYAVNKEREIDPFWRKQDLHRKAGKPYTEKPTTWREELLAFNTSLQTYHFTIPQDHCVVLQR